MQPVRQESLVSKILTVLGGGLSAVVRCIPHPANFTPLGAVGIYGGAHLPLRLAFLVPLLVMIGSDLGLWLLTGFDEKYSLGHISRLYVYLSILGYVVLGRWLARSGWSGVIAASLLGSLQFFLVTNFCDWLFQPFQTNVGIRFSRDLAGLLDCFAAGLPFYQGDFIADLHAFAIAHHPGYSLYGTILGDLIFTVGLFGLHGWLIGRKPAAAATPISMEHT